MQNVLHVTLVRYQLQILRQGPHWRYKTELELHNGPKPPISSCAPYHTILKIFSTLLYSTKPLLSCTSWETLNPDVQAARALLKHRRQAVPRRGRENAGERGRVVGSSFSTSYELLLSICWLYVYTVLMQKCR